ncbi:MAG: FAD-binding oxidoreductase [Gemmataceae bacterium]
MSQHVDILIVGGGIIGLTTAWVLSAEGATVAVVDQGEPGRQASWAGAGILPPADLAHAETPIELLRGHSMRLHPAFADELREQTGVDTGFRRCGGIELPDPAEPLATLPTEEWHGRGAAWEFLDLQALRRREPDLAPNLERGAWLPGLCQVRNPWHLRALKAGCAARNVQLIADWPVQQLLAAGTRALGVEGERGSLPAGQVLLTAGAWSDALTRQVGWAPRRPSGPRPDRPVADRANRGAASADAGQTLPGQP